MRARGLIGGAHEGRGPKSDPAEGSKMDPTNKLNTGMADKGRRMGRGPMTDPKFDLAQTNPIS